MNEQDIKSRKLDTIASKSLYSVGVMEHAIDYCLDIFKRHFRGHSILEIGPAEGVMTKRLLNTDYSISVVEGAKIFCEQLQDLSSELTVFHSLVEEFNPPELYDNILLGHVLEHVEEPAKVLRRISKWLSPSGQIMAAVPNCNSIHRLAAVKMGLLRTCDELNDLDVHHGHRRVYCPSTFQRDFVDAGLSIKKMGGYWLKPLSHGQIEANWSQDMINAFMQLGEEFPESAGEIYIIAKK